MNLAAASGAAWAASIAAALAGCAAAPIAALERLPDTRRVTLISMNDLHSHAAALPLIAAFAAAYRAAHPSEIVIQTDSGDWFSGTVYSALGPHPESAAGPELDFFARQGISPDRDPRPALRRPDSLRGRATSRGPYYLADGVGDACHFATCQGAQGGTL